MLFPLNWKVESRFRNLPKLLWEEVDPTPISEPKLAALSKVCLSDMGLTEDTAKSAGFLHWLNGESRLPGDQRISTRYAGHQFGHWAGQLGDGRAITLLEFEERKQFWEIQTKGSGLTPFSRMGDGKAVIRSSVREFLCSEHMHALGIPSSRALALIVGNDPVQRETLERFAIVARAFPTNLRFGHFEYCYHFQEQDSLIALIEYTRSLYYPQSGSIKEMFQEIVERTARLMANWMSVGFSHGVMNTDNMSILGITIDYGPFGFLEETKMDYICNHSDERGRYSFQNQPRIALWNLERLAVTFQNFVSREDLVMALQQFSTVFREEWKNIYREKLGLKQEVAEDEVLIQDLLKSLEMDQVDYTYFFRSLSFHSSRELLSLFQGQSIQRWLGNYEDRLRKEKLSLSDRQNEMQKKNPKIVLKNFLAQEIIEATEKNDFRYLEKWMPILFDPFSEHDGIERYSGPTPKDIQHCEVSCSS